MHLIIDIGNSFIKLAILDQANEVHYYKRYDKVLVTDLKQLYKKFQFEKAIVSSTRTGRPYFLKYLEKHHGLVTLSHKTKLPITNKYGTPKTLGRDRIAAVVGAITAFPRKNCLVIDLGTCITYDFIDKKKTYWGGNIAPGVELRLKAMHHFTSALPLVDRKWNKNILGNSTLAALQNGAVWGIKLEIESFIKTLTDKKGQLTVILTGGDASYFGERLDSEIFVDSNLVLKGLNDILVYNG